MKIVDYKTFTEMPSGVVYSEYEPCIFGDLCIRWDAIISNDQVIDWFYSELSPNPDYDFTKSWDLQEACEIMEGGESIPQDFDVISRDGMFDYNRKFAIYEKDDIKNMVKKLNELIDE